MERLSKRHLEDAEFRLEKSGIGITHELKEFTGGDDGLRRGRQQAAIDKIARTSTPAVDTSLLNAAFHKFRRNGKQVCLFNIIVALEWTPSVEYLEALKAAFTQASDLLLDATDGYMAIGQVVVGGKELMECADIQIFASNRLFPRSSVDGLNSSEKYQPIRLGRGLWNKNQRTTIRWKDQKGYATIVHEWGHYALGLKDQYLDFDQGSGLVTPSNQLVKDTLMSRLDSSELLDERDLLELVNSRELLLLSPRRKAQDQDKDSEWEGLRQHTRFSWLGIDEHHKKELAPPPENPIPAFHIIGTAADSHQELLLSLAGAGTDERKIDHRHCWVYIVRGAISAPEGSVVQGSLETTGDFQLLGAKRDDTVILIGHEQGDTTKPLVLLAQITDDTDGIASVGTWQDATPRRFPLVDVAADGDSAAPPYDIKLNVVSPDTWDAVTFPLGLDEKHLGFVIPGLTVLEGHVMLVSKDKKLAIASYAQGGSPFSGYPAHPNPIPAGSADGNALVFFYDEGDKQFRYTDRYRGNGKPNEGGQIFDASKVVTTTNLQNDALSPVNWEPRSYTFSITSNQSFTFDKLGRLHPTLVMSYDKETFQGAPGYLIVGRYDPKAQEWVKAYIPDKREDFIAAAPLNAETAPELSADPPQAERYRLFLIKDAPAS